MSGRFVALLRDRHIRGVAYLWPLDLTDADPETGAAMENASRQALAGALHLVQALVRSGPIPLTIVTRNAVAAGENGLCAPAQSPLWGFARTVALEHPELHCRCIDLDREDPDPAVLFAELTTASDEDQQSHAWYIKPVFGNGCIQLDDVRDRKVSSDKPDEAKNAHALAASSFDAAQNKCG